MIVEKKPFENIMGKGENAGNPQCFLPYQRQPETIHQYLICHLPMHSIWYVPKSCRLVKS